MHAIRFGLIRFEKSIENLIWSKWFLQKRCILVVEKYLFQDKLKC